MKHTEKYGHMIGQSYGQLKPVAWVQSGEAGRWLLVCECSCGGQTTARPALLLNKGLPLSCGCYPSARMAARNYRHGMRNAPEYGIWQGMRRRCSSPSEPAYERYGGAGITVCDRWRESFEAFYEDMGPRPSPEYSLDRHPDRHGDYEPGNCRWATHREQTLNRDVTLLITFQDETHALTEWVEILGINYYTLWSRLYERGWDVEKAFTEPADKPPLTFIHEGLTLTLKEWSEKLAIPYKVLHDRIFKLEWDHARAFSTRVAHKFRPGKSRAS